MDFPSLYEPPIEIPSTSTVTNPNPSTSIMNNPAKKRKRETLPEEEFFARASVLLDSAGKIPATRQKQEEETEVDDFAKFISKNLKLIKKQSRRRRAMFELHRMVLCIQEEEEEEENL